MTFKAKDDSLYFTDNGTIYCGAHLGTSARYTGRDISGQRIEEIRPIDVATAAKQGVTFACEEPRCGKVASLLVRP